MLAATGPVFVHLAIEPQIENTPVQFRPRAQRTVKMAFDEVPAALGVGSD